MARKKRIKVPKVRFGLFRRNPFTDYRGKFRRFLRITALLLAIIVVTPVTLVVIYESFPPPLTPLMVVRLFEGEGLKQDWVPLERISRHVPRAVIALEDATFCDHEGFDWAAIFDAAADRVRGTGAMRGGSTITQQTAKNVFLWPSRTMTRKAFEVPFTAMIEWSWSKRRIMEVYLNVIEWGPGIYGIEAASQAYFDKSASGLTQVQAARLAAVLPNPRRWSPANPTRYIRRRAWAAISRSRKNYAAASCLR